MTLHELKQELNNYTFENENRDVLIEIDGKAYNIGGLVFLLKRENVDFDDMCPNNWALMITAKAERGIEIE